MKYITSLLLFLVLIVSLPACADEETIILFDASSSMLESINGEPKAVTAGKIISDILNKYGDSERIGLRVIGVNHSKIFDYIRNPALLCSATSLLVPPASANKSNILNTLQYITVLGATPLEYALKNSVSSDFTPGYSKHIILITDGDDSCNGNPCAYIRQLAKSGENIRIDVIAISDKIETLDCLARATNGSIFYMKNSIEIPHAITHVTAPLKNNASVPRYNPAPDINYGAAWNVIPDTSQNDVKADTIKPRIKEPEVHSLDFGSKGIVYKLYMLESDM